MHNRVCGKQRRMGTTKRVQITFNMFVVVSFTISSNQLPYFLFTDCILLERYDTAVIIDILIWIFSLCTSYQKYMHRVFLFIAMYTLPLLIRCIGLPIIFRVDSLALGRFFHFQRVIQPSREGESSISTLTQSKTIQNTIPTVYLDMDLYKIVPINELENV